MAEANWFDVMSNPKKHGYKECPHCHGYGSSLKEEDEVCSQCKTSPYRGLVKIGVIEGIKDAICNRKEKVTDEQ